MKDCITAWLLSRLHPWASKKKKKIDVAHEVTWVAVNRSSSISPLPTCPSGTLSCVVSASGLDSVSLGLGRWFHRRRQCCHGGFEHWQTYQERLGRGCIFKCLWHWLQWQWLCSTVSDLHSSDRSDCHVACIPQEFKALPELQFAVSWYGGQNPEVRAHKMYAEDVEQLLPDAIN